MNTQSKLTRWLRLLLPQIVRRWEMRRLRDHKAATFLGRWDRACNRLWIKFQQKPRTMETMQWMDRNHGRLLRVCQNETRKLSPPNTTVAYHRDRNEPLRIATGDTVDEVAYAIGHDGFVYVFEEARWTVNGESLAKALGVKESEPAPLDPIALCAGIPTDVLAAEVARRIAAAANGLF